MENAPRVLGVLSGGDLGGDLLRRWAESVEIVMAADAGADLLLSVGVRPHLLIGDFDSASEHALRTVNERLHVPDQDSTDCDKLLAEAGQRGYEAITLTAVEGDLPDHVLATLHSAAKSPLDVRIAYRRGLGFIVKPDQPRSVECGPGRRVSLLPLEPCRGVWLEGLRWSLRDASLSARGLTSVSNRSESQAVEARIQEGAALLFVEYSPEETPIW